jgi:hypothetical protein
MMDLVFSFFGGMVTLLAFILYRMMSNDGWDDSNITNALRLLSHVTLHAEDFGKMYYTRVVPISEFWDADRDDNYLIRVAAPGKPPFWYIDKDELSEVVKSRP